MALSKVLAHFTFAVFSIVLLGACSRIQPDYETQLNTIRDLNGSRRDLLLSCVKNLCREISQEPILSRRDMMANKLIAKVVHVDFSSPSRQNTPDDAMNAYYFLLVGVSESLLDTASAELILSGMIQGRERFKRELARVGVWTHECFPSPTDWGCPPETDEILACLKSGDAQGTNATPRVQKILRNMSPETRERFPLYVEGILADTSGGDRGHNYRNEIKGLQEDLERTIARRFLAKWDMSLDSHRSKALRQMFENAVKRSSEILK